MEVKYKICIEKDGRVIFGKGREVVFASIQETRSLNAAAKKLKMSYRAAWGRLKASEERTGMKFVEIDSTERGMHLTPQAKAIMDRFEKLDEDVKSLLNKASLDLELLIQNKGK
ncbi:MAG: winged helix-turn-helix domain-containing protein [Syntrophales bacterium]